MGWYNITPMTNSTPSNIMVISLWSPPEIRPQAFLIDKLIKEWHKQNFSPILVSYESSQKSVLPCKHITIPQYKPLKFFNRTTSLCGWHKLLFHIASILRLKRITKQHKIKLIFSFSNPIDSNIWTTFINIITEIPFIAHFSDPFVNNPLKSVSGFQNKLNIWLEKTIMYRSLKLVFTNESQRHLMLKYYPKSISEKSYVFPHAYDPALYKNRNPKTVKSEHIRINHIGALYKNRTPETVFKAIQCLDKHEQSKLSLHFIGGINPYSGYSLDAFNALISKYNLNLNIEIEAPISYQESLHKMCEADVLLVIDPPLENSPFLPSKLIDYIGSKTPILAITPPNSPTQKALKELNHPTYSHQDVDNIAKELKNMITSPSHTTETSTENYSIRTVAKQWISLFQSAIQ